MPVRPNTAKAPQSTPVKCSWRESRECGHESTAQGLAKTACAYSEIHQTILTPLNWGVVYVGAITEREPGGS